MQLRNGKSVSKACKALQSSKTTATGTIPPSNMKYVDIVFPMGSVGRLHHSAIYDSSAAQVYRTTPQTDLGSYLFDIDTIIGCRTQKNAAEEGSANEACEFKIQWKPTVAPKSNLRSFSNAVIQETTIRSFIAGVENCEDDPELVRILWKPGWLPLAAIPSFGLIRDFWNTMEAESCFVEGSANAFRTSDRGVIWAGNNMWSTQKTYHIIDGWDMAEELTIEILGRM